MKARNRKARVNKAIRAIRIGKKSPIISRKKIFQLVERAR